MGERHGELVSQFSAFRFPVIRNLRQTMGAARYEGTIEDERRLFYVAMTRSQKFLHLTWAPVLETVFQPERILAWRRDGELIAVREIQQGKHLIVVYPEHADDGFVITAFITSKARSLAKRRQVWP